MQSQSLDLIGAAGETMESPANRRDMAPYRLSPSSRELWKQAYETFWAKADAAQPLLLIAGGLLLWSLSAFLVGQTPVEFVVMRIMWVMFGSVGVIWFIVIIARKVKRHATIVR